MKRVVFIDLVRAFAILSMIQGHLISGVLAGVYQNPDNPVYSAWNFNRGLTAPVFFFISGLIFTYLLFKNHNHFQDNNRIKKGLKRGLKLIIIGYILQFNVSFVTDLTYFRFLEFQTMFMSHVLHCIGFGLFFIIGLYFIYDKLKIPFWFLAMIFSFGIFLLEPFSAGFSWIHLFPLPVATYFNKDFSSIFPLIPWLGFVSWGSLMGYLIYKFPSIVSNKFTPFILTGFAIFFKHYRYDAYKSIYMLTKSETINSLMHYDYTFYHMPHVLIVISIFMFVANYVKNMPKPILKIGQNTLYIYVVHVLILYGSTFYPGLVPRFKRMLNPMESIMLAVIVESVIIFLVLNKEKISAFFESIYIKVLNYIRTNRQVRSDNF